MPGQLVKSVLAVFLGIASFFLGFAVGEPLGVTVAFIVIAVYYVLAQLFLSRGNRSALPGDWLIILLLNGTLIVTAILILLIEPDTKWHAVVVLISISSSLLGAGIAGWLARRSHTNHEPEDGR